MKAKTLSERVKKNGITIKYVEEQSEEIQLEVMGSRPYPVRYVENPTEYVKIDAVIRYIKEQSEEVQ